MPQRLRCEFRHRGLCEVCRALQDNFKGEWFAPCHPDLLR
jgi:hypothetical protein